MCVTHKTPKELARDAMLGFDKLLTINNHKCAADMDHAWWWCKGSVGDWVDGAGRRLGDLVSRGRWWRGLSGGGGTLAAVWWRSRGGLGGGGGGRGSGGGLGGGSGFGVVPVLEVVQIVNQNNVYSFCPSMRVVGESLSK
ncbi:hypothetical protein Tco_0563453 [Tanacetum coccineum]